jgi:hypothetical protein
VIENEIEIESGHAAEWNSIMNGEGRSSQFLSSVSKPSVAQALVYFNTFSLSLSHQSIDLN